MKAETRTFTGFTVPRYTPVPDELFDELMADLSGAELKVLLYIIRRTFGFKKDVDNISLNQICNGITTREGNVIDKGTGLSQQSVITALKGLIQKHAIVSKRRTSREKGYEPTTYSLNLRPISNNLSTPSPKIGEALPQKLEIQEPVVQQTDRQIRNSKAQSQQTNGPQGVDSQEQPGSSIGERQQKRPGSLKTLAEILASHQPTKSEPPTKSMSPTRALTPQILATVEEISAEFGDAYHLRSNTSQAANIWRQSGRSETRFVSSLYEARSITRQQKKVRRPMPYFWSTVRDLVGVPKAPGADRTRVQNALEEER